MRVRLDATARLPAALEFGALSRFVHLSSERTREPARQHSTFAEKQECHAARLLVVQGERGGIAARALATSQMQALSGWRTQAWSHWLTASVTPTAAPWPTLAARAWFAYGAEDVRDSAVCSTDLEPTRVLDQAACRERAVLDVSLGYVRQEG